MWNRIEVAAEIRSLQYVHGRADALCWNGLTASKRWSGDRHHSPALAQAVRKWFEHQNCRQSVTRAVLIAGTPTKRPCFFVRLGIQHFALRAAGLIVDFSSSCISSSNHFCNPYSSDVSICLAVYDCCSAILFDRHYRRIPKTSSRYHLVVRA